jgi:hypothetical protein
MTPVWSETGFRVSGRALQRRCVRRGPARHRPAEGVEAIRSCPGVAQRVGLRRAAIINDPIFHLAGYGSTRGGKRLDSSPDWFSGAGLLTGNDNQFHARGSANGRWRTIGRVLN